MSKAENKIEQIHKSHPKSNNH